jgi:phospholipid transport system substrate-binding protein
VKALRVLLGVGLALTLAAAPMARAEDLPPDVQVKSVTEEVLATIRQDKDIQAGNIGKLADLVDSKILPYFDFTRMTQLALAVNWRRATPEQQKALTQEFRTLLVRTYSTALSSYRDQVIDFKPLRARPEDTEVTVRSEVRQRGAQPVSIDYDMEKTPTGWKVFDVKVAGVSLITTYREDFANQVRDSGVDGLIKTLATKNRQAEAHGRT